MGMNLDTPLVKVLMVGTVVLCGASAFLQPAEPQSATASYTEAVRPYLAGRSDAELNVIGDNLCGMYTRGQTTADVTTHLVNGGASADSADQIALLVRAYKCPTVSKN